LQQFVTEERTPVVTESFPLSQTLKDDSLVHRQLFLYEKTEKFERKNQKFAALPYYAIVLKINKNFTSKLSVFLLL